MTPTVNSLFSSNFTLSVLPSKNYKMHLDLDVINGYCDKLEAMKQVIYKILNTERYQYVIYSWNYGIELLDLFGKPSTYVCAELERRIKEALLQDNRIESLENFEFNIVNKKVVIVSFLAKTIFGNIEISKEVNY